MIQGSAAALRVVLYEGTGSQPLSDDSRFDIFERLLKKGYAVTNSRQQGNVAPADDSPMLVLGQFDGGDTPEINAEQTLPLTVRDISGLDSEAIVELTDTVTEEFEAHKPGEWKPWFPVIDYDLCTNCMQCLSFCLFDVYGVSENGGIQVQNNNKCKTDCPACSRVCPEVAILFPKYRQGPINGDEVNPEDLEREQMKVDISSLLGGDIYAALRNRSAKAQSRFTKERDDARALKERQRCLVKLKQDLDIPDDVIMALPSFDQIQNKAEEALNKARDNKS